MIVHQTCDEAGSGEAVVLLHGFPFSRSMWRDQLDFLSAQGYRCIAPDLRGLGAAYDRLHFVDDEPAAAGTARMDEMARDVAGLMDELRIERATICGLSMGCYVAFEFMRLFPERVRALVLCGPKAVGPDEAEKQSREAQAQRALAEGMQFAVASISTNLLASVTVKAKPDVVARVTEMVLKTDPKGAAAAQRGMAARPDYSPVLTDIKVPTLIIAGRADGVRKPEDAEFIYQRIKGSQLVVIEDAGHLMNMEQPEAFNRALMGFLRALTH